MALNETLTGLTMFTTGNWDYIIVVAAFAFVVALAKIGADAYIGKK